MRAGARDFKSGAEAVFASLWGAGSRTLPTCSTLAPGLQDRKIQRAVDEAAIKFAEAVSVYGQVCNQQVALLARAEIRQDLRSGAKPLPLRVEGSLNEEIRESAPNTPRYGTYP